mgnify:CR=1 FL=1
MLPRNSHEHDVNTSTPSIDNSVEVCVAWDDVGELSLGGLSQTRGYLIFEFRTASTARARAPSFFLARFFVRKLLFLGDWHVDLRPLKCRTADVLQAARTLRQQAIRQQVVRLNAGRSDGWSGTL